MKRAHISATQVRLRRNAAEAWSRLREQRGVRTKLAKLLRLRWQSLDAWKTVPVDHVFQVEKFSGIPAIQLRPDIFTFDPLRNKGQSPKIYRSIRRSK